MHTRMAREKSVSSAHRLGCHRPLHGQPPKPSVVDTCTLPTGWELQGSNQCDDNVKRLISILNIRKKERGALFLFPKRRMTLLPPLIRGLLRTTLLSSEGRAGHLLFGMSGSRDQKWMILCPEEKKGVLMQKVGMLKEVGAQVLWIPWKQPMNQTTSAGGTS